MQPGIHFQYLEEFLEALWHWFDWSAEPNKSFFNKSSSGSNKDGTKKELFFKIVFYRDCQENIWQELLMLSLSSTNYSDHQKKKGFHSHALPDYENPKLQNFA